ncbi:MAG: hypothetical protein ACJAT7_003330 [Psychromonas sp.]|jgi:hypothetical protein|uniref:hypothetical protein n=1 Tax=Psychromonas sp. TaxID=1884585 RepID=UPI0039E35A1A
MVNINAHLPPAIAVPFHPPTEGLQHDNLIKPIIPKTEIISSYTKIRDDESRTQLSDQARSIIQDQGSQNADESAQQESSAEQRRGQFFARRKELSSSASEQGESQLAAIKDFKQVISVIQARYKNAVSPLPEPLVNYAV